MTSPFAERFEVTSDVAQLHAIESGWFFAVRKRAEWRDTDAFGHINHLTYLAWCEDARNCYLEHIGMPRLSRTKPGPVLKSVDFDYEKELVFGDEVVVTAKTLSVRQTSFRMKYAIWKNGLVGLGHALVVLVTNSSGARAKIPARVRKMMISRDGAIDESA